MAYAYTVDDRARLVRVVADGPSDVGAIVTFIRELAADGAFEPGFGVLFDARRSAFVPSAMDVQQILATLSSVRARFGGRVGLVPAAGVMFGVARMLATLAESQGVHVAAFTDPDEAAEWVTG